MREPDSIEKGFGPFRLCRSDASEGQAREKGIFQNVPLRQQVMVLEDEPDMFIPEFCLLILGKLIGVLADDLDRSGGRGIEDPEDLEQGRFPGAAWTDDREILSSVHFEGELIQHDDLIGSSRVGFAQILNDEILHLRCSVID